MSFFKSIGELVGKGIRDAIEAPIDIASGLYEGIQKGGLFDGEEPKNEQSKQNNKKDK